MNINAHALMKKLFSLFLPLCLLLFLLSACSTGFLGGTWQVSSLQHQHIRTLAVDPNNLQTIYAGDTQGSLFVSNDGGQHWTERNGDLPTPNIIHALAFDQSGKKLYAATDRGLFVSTDAAQHWSILGQSGKVGHGLPQASYLTVAFDFNAPHVIYVGTSHHGIFGSTDAGMTWIALNTGLSTGATINYLTVDNNTHRLWAATSTDIYRSDDRGKTWQLLNTGISAGSLVYAIQTASASGGSSHVVFVGTSNGLFRSDDAGAHWTHPDALVRLSIYAILVDFRQAQTTQAITAYIGTNIGVLRTTDSGNNWEGVAPGLPRDQAVYALQLGATNNSQLYAATNDVYLYPGTSGGFTIANLLPILVILVLFYVLYRVIMKNFRKNKRRPPSAPENTVEAEPSASPSTVAKDSSNSHHAE